MCLDQPFLLLTLILAKLCIFSVFALPATAAILKLALDDFDAMKFL